MSTERPLNPIGKVWAYVVPREASTGEVIVRATFDAAPVGLLLDLGREISRGNVLGGFVFATLTLPGALVMSWFIRRHTSRKEIQNG